MKSSAKSPEPQPETPTPFTAEAGIGRDPTCERDPMARLDELMAVVEALCPEPPQHPLFSDRDMFLL